MNDIQKCFKSFGRDEDGLLKNAGISVMNDPLNVKARVISPPEILFDSDADDDIGYGKPPPKQQYVNKATCSSWGAILLKFSCDTHTNLLQFS